MKSCLIVDDSKVVRMVARKIIEGLNFAIEEADNGQTAMDQCQKRMPDAILLDWNMPVMSGIDFLRNLRADAGRTDPGRRVLHHRERHPAHSGGDQRRRQRIHHEALRQRDHRVEVQPSRPSLTLIVLGTGMRPETKPAVAAGGGPYRVMVVDDSAVIRGLLTKTLESDPEIKVVVHRRQRPGGGRRAEAHRHRRDRARYRDAGDGRADRAAEAAGSASPACRSSWPRP